MDNQRREWLLDEARQLCDKLEPVVSDCGCLLSIYGSTVRKGRGRDLDVILVPKRVSIVPSIVVDMIKRELGAKTLGEPEKSLFADHCELLLLPDGHLLDIQVRLSRDRMDALDMYERYGGNFENRRFET